MGSKDRIYYKRIKKPIQDENYKDNSVIDISNMRKNNESVENKDKYKTKLRKV